MVYYDYALAHQLRRCRIIQIIDENYTEYASGRSLTTLIELSFRVGANELLACEHCIHFFFGLQPKNRPRISSAVLLLPSRTMNSQSCNNPRIWLCSSASPEGPCPRNGCKVCTRQYVVETGIPSLTVSSLCSQMPLFSYHIQIRALGVDNRYRAES